MYNCSAICVVVDLDDTLYKEIDYVRSGCFAVESYLRSLGFGTGPATQKLGDEDLRSGQAIDKLLVIHDVPPSYRDSALWIYRMHSPSICLDQDTQNFIDWARMNCGGLAIVTDGRSFGQRRKLVALGLGDVPCFISEEVGTTKRDSRAFLEVERRFQGLSYVYVGDNPMKDFVAPNKLGWSTYGMRDDGRNVHGQRQAGLSPEFQPKVWVADWQELQVQIVDLAAGVNA